MKDIKEIAKEMTREEFIKRYYHRCLRDLDKEFKCNEKCDKHLEHFKKQIKNITFKGEELTAICINDKTERDKRVKVLGITEGKEYPVKLCRYPNYYELVNDLGQVETYFMDRFVLKDSPVFILLTEEEQKTQAKKLINQRAEKARIDLEVSISQAAKNISEVGKTWMQQAMEKIEPKVKEQLQKAINNYFEGDKMEDQTIKVRCINNSDSFGELTKNKIYNAIDFNNEWCRVKNDLGQVISYNADRFEKVEDVLMVECIDNQEGLLEATIGKTYEVVNSDDKQYKIIDNNGDKVWCNKSRFKPVESQEEVKENICYNEECPRNNKNGLCLLPILPTTECKDRNTKMPKPLNYEEEYKKLKRLNDEYSNEIIKLESENRTLRESNESIPQLEEEKENYHTQMVILQEENKGHNAENIFLRSKAKDLEKERDQIKTYNMELTSKLKERESEIINLNELIENKDIKIEKLEKELEENKNIIKAFNIIKFDNEGKQIIIEVLTESLVNERKEKNKYKSQLGL